MAIEKVKAYFREHGMEERVQEFDVKSVSMGRGHGYFVPAQFQRFYI